MWAVTIYAKSVSRQTASKFDVGGLYRQGDYYRAMNVSSPGTTQGS